LRIICESRVTGGSRFVLITSAQKVDLLAEFVKDF
jgi:hypothetical protein